jgi:hypothetical protein
VGAEVGGVVVVVVGAVGATLVVRVVVVPEGVVVVVVVPDGAVLALTGTVGAMDEADGFLITAGFTGRRCCPWGPEAEATVPKLIVAASAADAAARRWVRRICRTFPFSTLMSGRWEDSYAMIATSAARLTQRVP